MLGALLLTGQALPGLQSVKQQPECTLRLCCVLYLREVPALSWFPFQESFCPSCFGTDGRQGNTWSFGRFLACVSCRSRSALVTGQAEMLEFISLEI